MKTSKKIMKKNIKEKEEAANDCRTKDKEKNLGANIALMFPKEKVEMKVQVCCPLEMVMSEVNFHQRTSDALEE
jgi:hypothetical protein